MTLYTSLQYTICIHLSMEKGGGHGGRQQRKGGAGMISQGRWPHGCLPKQTQTWPGKPALPFTASHNNSCPPPADPHSPPLTHLGLGLLPK